MNIEDIISKLESLANPESVKGMARYGINPENTLGISIPQLRAMAKSIGKSHSLADELWRSGEHEARILAAMTDEPRKVTDEQLERWVKDIDSWDVCDMCCSNLFDRTKYARKKAVEWSGRKEEYVKRAGFSLMAALAVHDKGSPDDLFIGFLPVIERESTDERNYAKKAVNWALRQIGKRNAALNRPNQKRETNPGNRFQEHQMDRVRCPQRTDRGSGAGETQGGTGPQIRKRKEETRVSSR